MKILSFKTLALLGSASLLSSSAFAFTEDFNIDNSANWTVNNPALSDIGVNFSGDYGATLGIPSAPNGTGTRGLIMTANNSGGVFSGFSVSPTGQSFSGNYRVSFDLWQNYVGPLGLGGSGTTQLSMFGIGSTGTSAAWAGSGPAWTSGANGVGFGVTLDGGSAADYRVYSSVAPTSYADGNAVYQSASRNGSDAYYAGFGGASAPAAQVALFAGQTGTTDAGEIGFSWRRIDIDVVGAGSAYWYIDGLLIGSVDLSTVTLGGGNLFLGHGDTNGSSSADPNDSLLNVTIVDNLQVVAIPEPSSLALLGLGGLALLARRRK